MHAHWMGKKPVERFQRSFYHLAVSFSKIDCFLLWLSCSLDVFRLIFLQPSSSIQAWDWLPSALDYEPQRRSLKTTHICLFIWFFSYVTDDALDDWTQQNQWTSGFSGTLLRQHCANIDSFCTSCTFIHMCPALLSRGIGHAWEKNNGVYSILVARRFMLNLTKTFFNAWCALVRY